MAPSKRNYGDTIEALKDIIKESLQNPERKQEFVDEGSVELIIGKEDLLLRVSNDVLKYGYQLLNAQLEFCLYFFVYTCACSNNLIIVLEDKRSINTELCTKRNLRVVYCLISMGYTWK